MPLDIDIGIIVPKSIQAKEGDFVNIKITKAEAYDLFGKII